MIELVMVIVLAGIMAAVFMPRWRGGTGFEDRGLRDQLVAALRYAQKSAIAARRTVCVQFSSGPDRADFSISNTYGAANCAAGGLLPGPDGNNLSVVASGSTGFVPAPASIVFDASGRPNAGAVITVNGLPATLNITLESETGYAH